MTNAFRTASFVPTAMALGVSNLPANAQPFGPGPGGMMGGGWGWGWGMGGFGGICLLAVALLGLWFGFPCGPSPKFVNWISTCLAKQLHRLICFASYTTCLDAVLKRSGANF